jgi:hypothetical protein
MCDVSHELERLAEEDGATFHFAPAVGLWHVRDKDSITVVRGALSRAEAARLYVEDRDLCLATPAAVLQYINARYRPYDTMRTFKEGWDTVMQHGVLSPDRYGDVDGQAYDRGGLAAIEYQRAIKHLADHREDVEKAGPRWLAQLLKPGKLCLAALVALAVWCGDVRADDRRPPGAPDNWNEIREQLREQLHKEMRQEALRCFDPVRGRWKDTQECRDPLPRRSPGPEGRR